MLYKYRATVVRVIDGDTIDVDIDLGFFTVLHRQRIRLHGIDAPEVRGSERFEGLETEANQQLWRWVKVVPKMMRMDKMQMEIRKSNC